MKIETDAVVLREFTLQDMDVMKRIYADEDVMRYIGLGGPVNEHQTRRMLEAFIMSYGKNNFGYWACIEKTTGNIIGHCGLGTLPDGKIEIAYLLDKPYWGKGITTAIAKETLRHGFEALRLKEIVAIAYPQNIASIRVMEKIGLEPSGEREYFGKRFAFFSKVNPSQL